MSAALPFRICAVILLLFAAGHTYGFLRFKPTTAAGIAAKTAMDEVTFSFGSAQRTYGDFYRGFGLFVTAYLLFAALIAFELPRLLIVAPNSFWIIAVGLLCVQAASTILSWAYFALPQTIFSSAVVACLAWGLIAARAP